MPLWAQQSPMKLAVMVILCWYALLSALSFAQYGWDKLAARRGGWRVPERNLRQLDWLGGWPGGLLAQRVFRHKRRKGDFMWRFWLIVGVHAVGWGVVAGGWWIIAGSAGEG